MDDALKLALKRDPQVLYNALGLGSVQGKPDRMHLCVFHQEKTGSLHTFQGDDSCWYFKCFGCGASGDFIDARMILESKTFLEVCAEYTRGEYKPRPTPLRNVPLVKKPKLPILDMNRACDFILKAQGILTRDHAKIDDRFSRGVNVKTCAHYGIGFRWAFKLRENRREYPAAWIFPVLRRDGRLGGVKFHFEKTPGRQQKSLWWFGTEPKEKPHHAFNTFWPAPEWAPAPWIAHPSRRIWICPGELKAFAAISQGYNATAWTGGESGGWDDAHSRRFQGRDVTVNWDDDPPKLSPKGVPLYPGRAFRDRVISVLMPYANSINAHTFGRLPDGAGKRDWCDASAGR